jgi:hypothetical protein
VWVVAAIGLVAIVLLAAATSGGRPLLGHVPGFLRYYAGVFALVSLTLTVLIGVLATDRMVLPAWHRVWLQSVHRALGIVSVAWLGLHICMEITGDRVGPLAAAVPFLGSALWVGFGTVAAYLMLTVMWTGIVRIRFAGTGRAWLWRPLHAIAYLAWPIALLHGLRAGRQPATWVTTSYLVLGGLAVFGLILRVLAGHSRRPPARAPVPETVWAAPAAGAPGESERAAIASRRIRRAVPERELADVEYLSVLRGEFEPANATARTDLTPWARGDVAPGGPRR